jgi:hypothetical protein
MRDANYTNWHEGREDENKKTKHQRPNTETKARFLIGIPSSAVREWGRLPTY